MQHPQSVFEKDFFNIGGRELSVSEFRFQHGEAMSISHLKVVVNAVEIGTKSDGIHARNHGDMGDVVSHEGHSALALVCIGIGIQKSCTVVDACYAAAFSDSFKHVIREVPWMTAAGAGIGMAGNEGFCGVFDNIPEGLCRIGVTHQE